MSSTVKLTSLEELRDFCAAAATFVDHGNDALMAVDMETRRFVDWIRNDRPRYWRAARQKCEDELAEARAALVRKKLRKMDDGREPDTTEEEDAIRKAKRKQEYIELKIANTQKWGRLVDQPINEYIGQARQLSALLEGDPAPSVRFLKSAVDAIERYLATEAPRTAESPGVADAGSASRAATSSPAQAEGESEPPMDESKEESE